MGSALAQERADMQALLQLGQSCAEVELVIVPGLAAGADVLDLGARAGQAVGRGRDHRHARARVGQQRDVRAERHARRDHAGKRLLAEAAPDSQRAGRSGSRISGPYRSVRTVPAPAITPSTTVRRP